MIIDGSGSSEGGGQATQVDDGRAGRRQHRDLHARRRVAASWPRTCRPVLEPGHEGIGWLAKTGRRARSATSATRRRRPARSRSIDGERFSVPGDRARHLADGTIELLGRDSVTINSGGEKIFVEEVEAAISAHPDVYDVVVCGRPSEQWGQEVVAIVRLRPGVDGADDVEASLATRRPATSPATSCRRSGSSSTRSCGRPPARPTTGGRGSTPRRPSHKSLARREPRVLLCPHRRRRRRCANGDSARDPAR